MLKKNILVVESDTLGAIAVIRSLGQAGHNIIAISQDHNALGFYSNFVGHAEVCPKYLNQTQFLLWLDKIVDKYNIDMIIPSESFMLCIYNVFDKYKHILPYMNTKDLIYENFSKFDLFLKFYREKNNIKKIRNNIPNCLFFYDTETKEEIIKKLSCLKYPQYLKTDTIWSKNNNNGSVKEICDCAEGITVILNEFTNFSKVLIQNKINGIGVGVFLLIWNGDIKACFMHKRLHEVPHTGGVSSYRCSWWNQEIYDDAIIRAKFLSLNGIAMFEYKWNEEKNEFSLIELNSRFWGSLHLALYSKVDFPALLIFHIFQVDTINRKVQYPLNVKCRNVFPLEVQYVWSSLKDSKLSLFIRFLRVCQFFLLFFDYRVYSDLFYPGDKRLYFFSFKKFIKKNILKTKKEEY